MQKPAFEIEPNAAASNAKSVVRLNQKLDYQQGESVCQKVRDLVMQGHAQWEVNIVNVDFCDSITLGFFIMMHTTVKGFKGSIIFRLNPLSQVWKSIKSSHLDRILVLVDA